MKTGNSYVLAACAIALIGSAGATMVSSVGLAQDVSSTPRQEAAANNIEGDVSEILNVSGYTYVEVKTDDGTVWAAAPSVKVRVGDSVSFSSGMPMRNFYSKSLQREFEVIYFVDRFISSNSVSMIDSVAATAHGRVDAVARQPTRDIEKAAGGYTIDEVLTQGSDLAGESLRVRGQVVKFTAGVMNTNWIRIRDGSTDDDLVIPADTIVAVGDVILVSGRLVLNMDLGQGYIIPAVLEDAEIIVE